MSDTTGSVAELLGLAGVEVDTAERDADGSWTLYATTAPGLRACCPGCDQEAGRVKELASHPVRHLVVTPVRVIWRKNRYFCDNSACERVTFCEDGPLAGRGGTVSEPAKDTMGHLVGDWMVPVERVADAAGVAWHTAHRGFVKVAAEAGIVVTETKSDADADADADAGADTGTGTPADPARPGRSVSGPLPPVKVLGIDDHRRGKPLYHRDPDTGKWVEDADRWQCVFVDATGGHGLLGQAEGRAAADAVAWLSARDEAWRAGVTHVTIDMSTVFKSAVREALPHAALAVDPFHVSQLANKAVGDVRRRVTYENHGRRGRAADPEYKIKNLLVRGAETLSEKARGKLLCTLSTLGDAGRQLTAAWKAKELLRNVLKMSPNRTGRATCRSEVAAALTKFFDYCGTVGATVPEVVTLAETVSAWREEIATAVLTGYSNAAAEGVNRLVKLAYRIAFGFTNVANQQRRSRYVASRSTRPQWLHPVTAVAPQEVAA